MFCVKCGKQLPDNVNFCTGCGTQVPHPISQQPNAVFHAQETQEAGKMENKYKLTIMILAVVLLILIFVAVGMAVYYFRY